jgi:MarR family transcriptional regulator for hemolysin
VAQRNGVHPPHTGWLLARASHALATAVAAELRSEGLSLRGYVVLQVAASRLMSQQSLVASLGLDKTTMVATVDELEGAGLVERQADPADRRVRLVAVTDAGRAALAQARAVVARTEDELLADLGDDRATLRRLLLTALTGRLGAQPPGGSCV